MCSARAVIPTGKRLIHLLMLLFVSQASQLRVLVGKSKPRDREAWEKIANQFENKSLLQCANYWTKKLSRKRKGKWRKDESERLVELVHEYGPTKWTLIAACIEGRNGKQCRERWHNQSNPQLNKNRWTREEDLKLIALQKQHGNKWAKIAADIPGRTDSAVKNEWNSSRMKKFRKRLDAEAAGNERRVARIRQQSLQIQAAESQSVAQHSLPVDPSSGEVTDSDATWCTSMDADDMLPTVKPSQPQSCVRTEELPRSAANTMSVGLLEPAASHPHDNARYSFAEPGGSDFDERHAFGYSGGQMSRQRPPVHPVPMRTLSPSTPAYRQSSSQQFAFENGLPLHWPVEPSPAGEETPIVAVPGVLVGNFDSSPVVHKSNAAMSPTPLFSLRSPGANALDDARDHLEASSHNDLPEDAFDSFGGTVTPTTRSTSTSPLTLSPMSPMSPVSPNPNLFSII